MTDLARASLPIQRRTGIGSLALRRQVESTFDSPVDRALYWLIVESVVVRPSTLERIMNELGCLGLRECDMHSTNGQLCKFDQVVSEVLEVLTLTHALRQDYCPWITARGAARMIQAYGPTATLDVLDSLYEITSDVCGEGDKYLAKAVGWLTGPGLRMASENGSPAPIALREWFEAYPEAWRSFLAYVGAPRDARR